jgi:hypothetical protein
MKGDCSLMSRLRATHLILFPLWDKDYETLGKKQPIFQIHATHSVCQRQALDLAAVRTGCLMALADGTCRVGIERDKRRGKWRKISGRYQQRRMQKRLSARSSGIAESSRSGGRSDSELKPVTPEIKTEIPSLTLRLLREEDAQELFLRNDQNRDHLRQWMPWLDETKSASDTLNFIRRSLDRRTCLDRK